MDGDPALLEEDLVWNCFYCYTCQSRCPRKNSVAVVNQVIRSMQVEGGQGRRHVEMFAAWGEQFYDKGMGGTPHVFFAGIAQAWGPKWKAFMEDRDRLREALGLGPMTPSKEAVAEMRTIMEDTGFKDRLLGLGAWGDGTKP
jgi:heterodisulfide reductase subunit C